jgi:hypothetical protein
VKLSLIIFLAMVAAVPAAATIDAAPDQIGVYFDLDANETCLDMGINLPFWVYVIITNPTSEEVRGVEFEFCPRTPPGLESLLFKLSTSYPSNCQPIHTGPVEPCIPEAFNCNSPIAPTGTNVIVMSIQYMILGLIQVEFFLGPHPQPTPDDGLPGYLGAGDEFISLGVSSGHPEMPVASINGEHCPVNAAEKSTFERLKCLYR